MEALLFRRLSRVEFAGQLLHCAENVELRSLVVSLFLAFFEIFFGSHIVGLIADAPHMRPNLRGANLRWTKYRGLVGDAAESSMVTDGGRMASDRAT